MNRSPIIVRTAFVLMLVLALAAPAALTGCNDATQGGGGGEATRSAELTPGEFPDKTPPDPQVPPPPQLRDPKTAVYSYLLWISYAYRILNSDVATMAFSEYEEVRVNSYVEFNRQEGRAIDQRLIDFKIKDVESKGDTATVTAREQWRYRYIDITTGDYQGPALDVTYDTKYTVVDKKEKGWLVDEVTANAVGEAPK